MPAIAGSGSIAAIRSPCAANDRVALPVPAPASTAVTPAPPQCASTSVTRSSGYPGRIRSYWSAASPNAMRRSGGGSPRSVPRTGDLVPERLEDRELGRGQRDVQRRHVLLQPLDPLGAGNRRDRHAKPVALRVDP